MTIGLVLAVTGLLLANAFFVGAEFAILSARRSSIEPRAEAGSRAARTVLWAMENVSLMLATAQLGITVCSVSLGIVAEPALAHSLEDLFHKINVPESASHPIAIAIALLVIVGLHVVIGEMVPKNAAVASPDKAALVFGPPLVIVARVAKPIIVTLNAAANGVLRLFGVQPKDEVTSAFTADEVHSIVSRSSQEGTLLDDEGLLTGAIEFSSLSAVDVMVPMAQVVTVSAGVSAEDLERVSASTGFSRVLVEAARDRGEGAGESDVLGYLHIKDALSVRPGEREEPMAEWRIRALAGVDAATPVESVLSLMRKSGAHVALVKELGAVAGVVFLEDIIELLVGEVRDEIARADGPE